MELSFLRVLLSWLGAGSYYGSRVATMVVRPLPWILGSVKPTRIDRVPIVASAVMVVMVATMVCY